MQAITALKHQANTSHYKLLIRTVPDNSFSVTAFTGSHYGISRDYSFSVDVTANSILNTGTVIGNCATLEIYWGGTVINVNGLVTRFFHIGQTPGDMAYRTVISSPLAPLKNSKRNRVFVNKSTPDIIKEIFATANFGSRSFRLDLTAEYPEHPFIVQYAESDFDFLQRLIARAGIFFCFEAEEDQTQVVFCDDSSTRPAMPEIDSLIYRPQTGAARTIETVYQLSPAATLLPGLVELNDYNDQDPSLFLNSVSSSENAYCCGVQGVYGDHFTTTEEGETVAQLRVEALDVRRATVMAVTDCKGIRPGYMLTIREHPCTDLNGRYLIISVDFRADQATSQAYGSSSKAATFTATMQMIKAGTPYRSDLLPTPQVLGLFSARIESKDSQYAFLDDQGRYHIRTDFDRSNTAEAEASHPVRLVQPYGGQDYGMHFPLHGGTDVVVSCLNGDLNRPVVVGALSTDMMPSIVTSDNNTQNIIRTASGNELCMDDRIDQEKIDLFTAERKNILTLDATRDAHKIRLATEEGKLEIFAKKTMLIESGDSQTVQVGKDHLVTVENAQQLMTRNQEISMQAATDIRLKAKENIQFDAENENIEMTVGQDMVVDINNNLSIEVRNEDMQVKVNSGALSISAARNISLLGDGGGPVTIKQGSGTIQVSTDGNLTLKGPMVNIYGNSINLKGSSIGGN